MFVNESLLSKECHLTELTISGKQVKIYDNCLPLDVFAKMNKVLLGPEFPWFYNDKIIEDNDQIKPPIDGYDTDDIYQFTHAFLQEVAQGGVASWSHTTEIIIPILNIINARAWTRVKGNLGHKESKHLVGGWHYDLTEGENKPGNPYTDSFTAQLYMNTNNGYTLMETGDRIESVENRLLLHPCNILHTGITQTDTKVRVVLNFNFF